MRGGVLLSGATRQKIVTKPFEDEIVAFMRASGFTAGAVSEDGVWTTQNGRVVLSTPPPGEIDCLAVNADGQTLVLEAKVLSFPYTSAGLANVLAKLGSQDSESFLAKLSAKVGWTVECSKLISHRFDGALGIIVLDRILPGIGAPGDVIVSELSTLGVALQHLKQRHDST